MGFSPHQAIDRVVVYAKSKGLNRFAGLVSTGVYGQRASTSLIRSVESNGGQMVTVATYDRSAPSMLAAVRKLSQSSGYDAVLIGDSGRGAVQLVPLIRKNGGATARILGTELWNTENSLAQSPAMSGALFASVPDNYYNQLSAKYRARFGKGTYRLSSMGYDSVLLVTKIAANWKVGAAFPVAQLNDPDGFTGIDGAFRFSGGGVAERALEVQQIGAGTFTVVSAAPKGFQK
jgi:ABC-type branched-subunit amino acid transport system substrate-binding protein